MKPLRFDYSHVKRYITQAEIDESIKKNFELIRSVIESNTTDSDVLGWIEIGKVANDELLNKIENKANEIKQKADVFVLIGVGGSNQGARAVIKALGKSKPEVIYTGNNLSPVSMKRVLSELDGKSVYVNVIAKNFATLEPGITFRVIRNYMEKRYGQEEAAKRIIATGSMNNSSLQVLANQKGYLMLPFPLDVGGRYSVLSAVGLLPVAVAGVDIKAMLKGAEDMRLFLLTTKFSENPIVLYGVIRNLLLQKGYNVEILAFFEPLLEFFSKWWVQLFGESEGKEGKGIFPTAVSFSEDLHSLGQYIQEGQRMLFETFLNLENPGEELIIPVEESDIDGFSYIENKDFAFLNRSAYEATVKAHEAGGVPCMILNVPELNEYYFGQLFYFFQYACYISGSILGVDPFDQPGVEAYKTEMFAALGK